MNFYKAAPKLLFLIWFFVIRLSAVAQTTTVRGIVIDSVYHQPLPYVNIFVPVTKITTQSNMYGKFKISSKTPFDQIKTSYGGYKPRTYNVEPGKDQEIN